MADKQDHIPADLKEFHKLCFRNELLLRPNLPAGCFSCLKQFNSSKIITWMIERDERDRVHADRTALCPHCGIDAVIPLPAELGPHAAKKKLLARMNEAWFTVSIKKPFEKWDAGAFFLLFLTVGWLLFGLIKTYWWHD